MSRHLWREITALDSKQGFHLLQRVRECTRCASRQGLETLYDFGTYSARGGPKVRGYTWQPLAGRCASQVTL